MTPSPSPEYSDVPSPEDDADRVDAERVDAERVDAERVDALLERVTDDRATAPEWDELRALAESDPDVWRRLAMAEREARVLSAAVDRAVAIADNIELPAEASPAASPSVLARIGSGAGWLVAACVGLLWLAPVLQPSVSGLGTSRSETDQTTLADTMPPSMLEVGPSLTGSPLANAQPPSALLQRYLDKGREQGTVLGEMPTAVVLDARPSADGLGLDVVYLRQIVERARVNDTYRLARDDAGRATPVRVSLPTSGTGVH